MSAKRVLLIDVDSTIPNLALMKISSYHKALGDQVGFNISDPDLIYASVIFKKNRHLTDGLRLLYPNAQVIIGGTGHDLTKKLPQEIEDRNPDYSLYPEMDYSLGHTSRGCIRHCYFCVVPQKEGPYRRYKHPSEWVQHAKVKLLDNNWYADPEWFFETSEWLITNNVAVDVTQGMDIRLLTPEIAAQLKRLRWWRPMHFAFDDMRSKDAVLKGLDILTAAGIDTKRDVSIYVYCHDDAHYDDAVERCRILKAARATPYVMCNIDRPRTKRMKALQRWTARPHLFWSCDIGEYDPSIRGHRGMVAEGRKEVTP